MNPIAIYIIIGIAVILVICSYFLIKSQPREDEKI